MPPGRVQAGPHRARVRLAARHRAPTAAASSITSISDRVYVGYVVGLNYEDPRFKPFEAFQQFKHHPRIKPLLEGGEILAAGARTIVAGGYQSLPKLEMPGAMLIGDAGGTLNVFKIKGIHQAIRSGVLAAEHLAEARQERRLRRALARIRRSSRAARSAQLQAGVQARPVFRDVQRRASSRC